MTGVCAGQEERLQELRDIHHTETKSQTELIDRLRREAEEAASFSKASSASISKAEQEASKHKQEVERLRADLTKATTLAKEEEEKRTKAISLLKTVRQKLVKTEKERDDAIKDAGAGRRKVEEELEKERVEKAQAQADVAKVNAERDSALAGMKSHFDREVAGLKDRQQKEVTAIKGQLELEAVTMRVGSVSCSNPLRRC
jgi:chromosome segregation ATPase